jgi:hypothetical protein
MIAPFGSDQFIVLPVEDELPVARYAAVWSKNYSIQDKVIDSDDGIGLDDVFNADAVVLQGGQEFVRFRRHYL